MKAMLCLPLVHFSRSHCPLRGRRQGDQLGQRLYHHPANWSALVLKKKKNQLVNDVMSLEMNCCLVNYMASPLFYVCIY